MTNTLYCLGFGYVASHLAKRLPTEHWRIIGTTRHPSTQKAQQSGRVILHSPDKLLTHLPTATHLLISTPPDEGTDPFIAHVSAYLSQHAHTIEWIGYLSTTGVYGDHAGGWVTEMTAATPTSERSKARLTAEQAWQALGARYTVPVQRFRLSGIYGPGRNVLSKITAGTAQRIEKPGHVFSRIHVADIAGILQAALEASARDALYNLADDLPAPAHEVTAYGCQLLHVTPPPLTPITELELSPMLASFYAECRRVANDSVKKDLAYKLLYPTYREGLSALHDEQAY